MGLRQFIYRQLPEPSIQHYYSSPYAYCLLQSKINSILQSRSILTTLILPTFGRMTALFWAFIYSWALYPDGNKKGRIFVAQTSMYKHITYDNEHSNACQRRECCEGQVGGNSLSRSFLPIVSALFRLIFWRPEATRARWREPAGLFAKAASYTRLWIVQTGNRLVVQFSHTKRLERTYCGANFATDTILCPNVRLGPVCSLNSIGLISLRVSNRPVRATPATHPAFDTSCNIDAVRLFLFPVGGRVGQALAHVWQPLHSSATIRYGI